MTIKKLLYFSLILSLAIFAACSSSSEPEEQVNEFAVVTQTVGDDYVQNYSTASGGVNIIMDALYLLMTGDEKDDLFIVDLRGATDYNYRHLKGAVNIGLSELIDKVKDGTIPEDKRIICVCYTGQNASIATSVLNLLEFDAQNLKFGMCGVTTDVNLVTKSDMWLNNTENTYTLNKTDEGDPGQTYDFPTLSTGKTTSADIIKARYDKVWDWGGDGGNPDWGKPVSELPGDLNGYFVINYWSETEYMNPGHIEGAYQFTPKNDFLTTERLNELPTDQKIAVYCYTGQTSAQMTAYLRLIGYEAYSVTYGVNGFSYDQMTGGKYSPPDGDYTAVLEPAP
ncbi:MAG: rhodanese-like domain-containing protein [Bacteroidetes bacterium]|nr:rhodanese-like domain-containing protein [Bacteroidota bacterium]